MDFLRAMRGYAENEEAKDENDIFGVLIATEKKKLRKGKQIMTKKNPKPHLWHADEGCGTTKQEK